MKIIKQIDIAIVGAGVAGCSVALELAKMGFRDSVVLFEKEEKVLNSFRFYDFYNFGLEFKKLLRGEDYALKYERLLYKEGINLKTEHTLIDIKDNLLIFKTNKGLVYYRARKIVFALGSSLKKDESLFNTHKPQFLTVGKLWELAIKKELNIKKIVLFGSEFLALRAAFKLAKIANLEIVAIIENSSSVKTPNFFKYYIELIKRVPIFTNIKSLYINSTLGKINTLTFKSQGVRQSIDCEAIVLAGDCLPNSELFKNMPMFNDFNKTLNITQNYQVTNNIFLAGNIIRGSYKSYLCSQEGIKVAKNVANSYIHLNNIRYAKIKIQKGPVLWYYPSLVDIDTPAETLCYIKINSNFKGKLKVFLNEQLIKEKNIKVKANEIIKLEHLNIDLKEKDLINIKFEEKYR